MVNTVDTEVIYKKKTSFWQMLHIFESLENQL